MSNLFDYFQTLSTREGTSINESFICCVKCFNHGINKIFSKNNINELKSHLLEFHAIVVSESGKNSAVEKRFVSCDDSSVEDSTKKLKRPSIWKYFKKNKGGDHVCLLCEADDICTKYKPATSVTNLRRHVEQKHGYTEPPKVSGVWKYFCKSVRKGKVVDNEHVYCGKCLENGKKQRYKNGTSTTSLKSHLLMVHSIDVRCDKSESNAQASTVEPSSHIAQTTQSTSVSGAGVRKFFKQHSNSTWCVICEQEGNSHKFSQKSSATTLRRHLIVVHQMDPHSKSFKNKTPDDELSTDVVPANIMSKAKAIVDKQMPRYKDYFIRIDDTMDVYCCFCLTDNRKKGYRHTTSETGLKRHLREVHNFFTPNDANIAVASYSHPEISQEVIDQARILSETKGLRTFQYFIDDPHNSKFVLCVFCAGSKGIKHKYAKSTGSTNLRLHLVKKHGIDPKNPETETSEYEEDSVMVEDEEPLEEPTPVHHVLLPALETSEMRDTKYCRSCGRYDVSFFAKFSSVFRLSDEDSDLTVGDVYSEVTGVPIYSDDGMSQVICYPCEANLKTAYHFKTLANQTEEQMAQKFGIDQPTVLYATKYEESESLDSFEALNT